MTPAVLARGLLITRLVWALLTARRLAVDAVLDAARAIDRGDEPALARARLCILILDARVAHLERSIQFEPGECARC